MDLVGRILGNFRMDHLLGEGGMGAVFQAYDLSLQRDVAIKLIHPHLARQFAFQERFIQEARLMARLDHPGIVKVFAFGKQGDLLFLPMEFIGGGNLRQFLDELIRQKKWIPLEEAVLLVQQLCQIVEYAHQKGVLHRDIKPANLMLKPEHSGGLPFRVVLTDLGLGKLVEGLGLTQEGTSMGTPAYMSPEQALGQETDPRSDVYSLGVLLYELSVGRLPFEIRTITEATRYHTQLEPPAPRFLRPELPEGLESVILKALEKDPNKRYASARELASALAGTFTPSTEIMDQGNQERVSLITEYQSDQVASGPQEYASLMTILENKSSEPRGVSVFGDLSALPSPEARIQIVSKDTTARFITLPSDTATIGREKDNTIVVEDQKASRKHAQITRDGAEFYVMDLNSRNGTYLDKARLLPGVPEILKPGQTLHIGDTSLRLIQSTAKAPSRMGSMIQLGDPSAYTNSSAGLVGVSVTPQQLTVEAGGSVTATISVLNESANVDHFSLSITGIPGTWVVSLSHDIQLMPGERKEDGFTLSVPRAPQSRAGPYPIRLKVSSQRDPSQFVEFKLTLTIAAYSQFTAELHPQRLRAGQTGSLTVSNQGNLQEIFTVQFKDAADELTFQPQQLKVKVPEGESAVAEYRVQPRQLRLLGGEKSHTLNAQVSLPKGESQTLQAQVVSRGLLPVWLPPILLLLCCFFAFSLARIAPPILFPTPTATLTATPTAIMTATLTPSATAEPGAPLVEEWCVYPSNQPPVSCADAPIQLTIAAGQTVTIQWRVSNVEKVVINPLGDQAPSGTISPYTVPQTTTFILDATNAAQKRIQKTIQVIVDPPTPTPITPTIVTPNTPTLPSTPVIKIDRFCETGGQTHYPTMQVNVPANYKIIGGGAKVNWTGAGAFLTASYPDGFQRWVAAGKDHDISDPSSITACALALFDPEDIWDVKIFQNTSENSHYPVAEVTVPADYTLVGGGARIDWSGAGNLLTASYPNSPSSWEAQGKDHMESSPATITVFAIGVKPKNGNKSQRFPETKQFCFDSALQSGIVSMSKVIDSQYTLLGGGAIVHWSNPGSMLTASYPDSEDSWSAVGKDHEVPSSSSLTVCLIGFK